MEPFKALWVFYEKDEFLTEIKETTCDALSKGDVLVAVHYTSVNYKDMLALQEQGGVIRSYPMIPGIDFSGVVIASQCEDFKTGDNVFVVASDIGVVHTGGFSQIARVESGKLMHVPSALSLKDVMIYGTAGYTAALSIHKLYLHGLGKDMDARILVTGASGGVGSLSLAFLAAAGFKNITAMIRKPYQEELVRSLGAHKVIYASDLSLTKPLMKQEYDYCIDTVGGSVVERVLPKMSVHGAITVCGNAAGAKVSTTLLPFILRGITMIGVDCVQTDRKTRETVWSLMANPWNILSAYPSQEVDFSDIKQCVDTIKDGKHLGRTVVRIV